MSASPIELDHNHLAGTSGVFSEKRPLRISTRKYAGIVKKSVGKAGLDCAAYGTHSLRHRCLP